MIQAYVVVKNQPWALIGFMLLGMFGLYALALDQGFLLSLFQGAPAFDMNVLHELVHDTRHAAGFPCHYRVEHMGATARGSLGAVRTGAGIAG